MMLQEKAYPVRMVLKIAGLSSAAWYTASREKLVKLRPGPKPAISDDVLLVAIRKDLDNSRFHSEGHKKVRARLRRTGICVGRKRLLRVMGARGSFRMILHRKHRFGLMPDTFKRIIIQVDVGYFYCFTILYVFGTYFKSVILRGDLRLACDKVFDRMIEAAMSVVHFICPHT